MLLKKLDLGQAGATSACDVPCGGLSSADNSFALSSPSQKLNSYAGDTVNSKPIRQFEAAFEGLPPSCTTACLHFFSTWNHLDHCAITA